MKKTTISALLLSALLTAIGTEAPAQTKPDTWTAQDALGRKIGTTDQYGKPRKNKVVGMFFVIWHGVHGYDRPASNPDNAVMVPTAADSLSPYDNQKIIDANPQNPQYGAEHAMHHWGEPYLGYYVANDEWVIRKHAQMLSDAGVDMIMFDVTNQAIYLPVVKQICDVYTKMRKEGNKTPQISFIFNTNAKETLENLFDSFYGKNLYKELWFRWKGKPLIFCPPEGITPDMAGFFTVRHSWFCSAWDWFGDGHDKCPWADIYPQKYGWHDRPDKPEMIAVSPATHPIVTNDMKQVGRSYHDGAQPDKEHWRSGEELCFREQFERAMEVDPEFIYFSGWNEWTAMRFVNPGGIHKVGEYDCKKGDSYFVDLFNHEFSRDIEPLRGDFGDNYYYQLCDFIRRYKGVEPTPVYSAYQTIDLGDMQAWNKVKAEFADDKGDVFHRNHYGYGSVGQYVNNTGRNDILTAKVANDGKTLYFYVRTAAPVTPFSDPKWMRLFLDVKGSESGNWEGFQYRINNDVTDNKTSLEKSLNGWNWQKIADLDYRVAGNELVVAVPAQAIGIANANDFAIDFKWIDNAVEEGDIQECLSDGDAAPNGRFRYRYQFKK